MSYIDEAFPSTDDPDVEDSVATLEARVKHLVESYQELERSRDAIARRYAADYKKWRHFKQWLRRDRRGGGAQSRSPLAEKENLPDVLAQILHGEPAVAACDSRDLAAGHR